MSRIARLYVSDFLSLVEFAREIHTEKGEPIPSFHNSKLDSLQSCLDTPFMGFGGQAFYKGLVPKASILFYLLVRNHVMSNGNKRLACMCLSYFIFINNKFLPIPQQIFYKLAKQTVLAKEKDKDKTIEKIETVIKKFLAPLPKKIPNPL